MDPLAWLCSSLLVASVVFRWVAGAFDVLGNRWQMTSLKVGEIVSVSSGSPMRGAVEKATTTQAAGSLQERDVIIRICW